MAKKKRVTGRRSHTKQRRPSPYKRSVLMILSVLCLLSGVLGVNAVKLHAKNTAYKQQEAELKTQIKSEQARAEEIKEYEQYVQTDDYMKEIAEDKLNLVDPNEIVFKPIKGIVTESTNPGKDGYRILRKITPGEKVLLEFFFFYANNEPKSVPARDLGDCRDNLRNLRSVFLTV